MLDTIPRYLFNAKELDEESGMYYYEARYYAPPTFISRDPLFEKCPFMSPYAYCNNNPVIYIDPDGMIGRISIYCAGTDAKTRASRDDRQFKFESEREIAWGFATTSYSGRTTSSFLQTLRDVTAAEGSIEYLSIYSHSASYALLLDNGQYGYESISGIGMNPRWNNVGLSSLVKSINDGDIEFAPNALVVFAGCKTGKTESNGASIYSFAKTFTEQTGVASIGATNNTYPHSGDKVRTVDRGQYSLFYKDANGNTQQLPLGNKLNKETIQKAVDFVNGLNE
jgi:RHS repeat-associated protein